MTLTQSIGSTGTSAISGRTVGAGNNQFLQLLIANLRNQTPTEPLDNNSFMNQMSQLSSMEEQKKLNDNLGELLGFQSALARLDGLSRGAGLLGKEIEYVTEDGKSTATGTVDSIRVDEQGTVRRKLANQEISIGQVVGIRQPAASN